MNNVRENIRHLREKLGMSQDDIAKKLHTARPVISNWERGISEPSSSQIFKLAQIFGVSVDALFSLGDKSKTVVVFDTSVLIKRPAIIKEALEKFDEVIIPRVVIDELNNQKDDKAKAWLKQRAWYVMRIIDELREKNKKLIVVESKEQSGKNDERIAKVAIDRATQSLTDQVYMFARDVYFTFLVKERHGNLYHLTFEEYTSKFSEEKDYNIAKTQNFLFLLKNREFEKLKKNLYDPEVDINFIDPETGYTPLIQALRLKNISIIKDLLEKYRTIIDIDKHDKHKYGFTPLLHTVQMQDIELMNLLIEAGADVDVGSEELHNYGKTSYKETYEGIALYEKCFKEKPIINCTVNRQTLIYRELVLSWFDGSGTLNTISKRLFSKSFKDTLEGQKKQSRLLFCDKIVSLNNGFTSIIVDGHYSFPQNGGMSVKRKTKN
jgi:transcriptional regulator with XRE-family HTH domain